MKRNDISVLVYGGLLVAVLLLLVGCPPPESGTVNTIVKCITNQDCRGCSPEPNEGEGEFEGESLEGEPIEGEPVEGEFPEGESGVDSDNDGLSDDMEAYHGTKPDNDDTDRDGLSDGDEVWGTRTLPLHADTDGDGVLDGEDDDPREAAEAPTLYNETQQAIWDALEVMEAASDSESALAAGAAFLETNAYINTVYYVEGTEEKEPILGAELANGVLFMVTEGLHAEAPSKIEKPLRAPGKEAAKSILNSGQPEHPLVFLDLYEPGTNESDALVLSVMAEERGHNAEYGGWGTGGYGSVEWFKTIANYGMVYVDTHGGFAVDASYVPGAGEEPDYRPHYHAIYTADLRNTAQDSLYLSNGDFANRRVCLGARVIDGPEDDDLKVRKSVYYTITNRFFDTYCGTFEPHSIVWFNACKTGLQTPFSPPNSLPGMWETFLSKNAGIVLGWDWIVTDAGARRASLYMISRLLGDNDYEGKKPPLRPYSFTEAWTALQEDKAYNLDEFYPYGRKLKDKPRLGYVPRDYGTFDQEEPILAPSIIGIFLDVEDEELSLRGNFGDREGEVLLGGSSLSVQSWDTDEVVVSIGENDHGLVKVKVGNVESNAVPLTQWSWQVEVEGVINPAKGPEVEATATFRGRADIHRVRPEPEDEATRDTHGADWWTVTAMEQDGSFNYSFSGTFVDGDYRYEHAGGGTVPATFNKTTGEAYQGTVNLNPDAGTFQAVVIATGVSHVTRTKISDPTDVKTYDEIVSIPMIFDGAMEEYGAIEAGTATVGSVDLEWERIEPVSPPDENTPG